MILNKVQSLLTSCSTDKSYFPTTILYNEGWMLRLILDCFSTLNIRHHQLTILKGCRWYSEALLPSAFLPQNRSDFLGESWTHADGVIGQFEIGKGAKANLILSPNASHFVVLEGKCLVNYHRVSNMPATLKMVDSISLTLSKRYL